MVMLFVPYPMLTDEQRMQRLPPIHWEQCCPSVQQLLKAVPAGRKVALIRLIMTEERPRMVAEDFSGALYVVSQEGHQNAVETNYEKLFPEVVQGGVSAIAEPIMRDQWTVQERYGPHRPLWKVSVHDEEERVLYLSSKTGEVLLETTAWQRGWNWIGAVVHWVYLPEWREHLWAWEQTLSSLALVAAVGIGTGLWVGVGHLRRASNRQWQRAHSGWWRWHHRLGLLIGGFTLTWALSGYLTLDAGRLFSVPTPTIAQRERFMGSPIQPEDLTRSLEEVWKEVQPASPVCEVAIVKVEGTIHYVFRHDATHQIVVLIGQDSRPLLDQIATPLLVGGAERAMGARVLSEERMEEPDEYYYPTAHHSRPLPVLRLVFDDPAATWFYLDPGTGRIIEVMDRSRRVFRWLVSGLHSWNVGWLQDQQRIRKGWILLCSILGIALTLTGLWIGLRRILARRASSFGRSHAIR